MSARFKTQVGRTGSVLRPSFPEDRAAPPYQVSRGFSLLETVLALAVFAIVVVPAIGLVALSYRNASAAQQGPNAIELKALLEVELRGLAASGPDPFDATFLSSPVVFYASSDLQLIERDGAGMLDSEKHYKVVVGNPIGYSYGANDAYRVFLFNVVWPAFVPGAEGVYVNNEANAEGLEQLILPSVLRR